MKQSLIDHVEFRVRAGNGGAGSLHFRREKYVPKGGPDGGDGGNGGSIYLLTNPNMTTLLDYAGKDHFDALGGERGSGRKMHGKDAEDLTIEVPVGTEVCVRLDAEGNPSKDGEWSKVFDLTTPGEKAMIARGGAGGRGNTAFKSSVNTTPMYAEAGQWGEEKYLKLEMKVLADIGLVGLPNAGKSTLLSVLTAAHPEIANYPFTTISPNLGVMEVRSLKIEDKIEPENPASCFQLLASNKRQLVIADIPGLIEDAHKGKGLGVDFLRHIERCKKLVYVISPTEADLLAMTNDESTNSQINNQTLITNLKKQFETVRNEVISYGHDVDQKPRVIVINKMDVMVHADKEQIAKEFDGEQLVFVSAATHEGIEELKTVLIGDGEGNRR